MLIGRFLALVSLGLGQHLTLALVMGFPLPIAAGGGLVLGFFPSLLGSGLGDFFAGAASLVLCLLLSLLPFLFLFLFLLRFRLLALALFFFLLALRLLALSLALIRLLWFLRARLRLVVPFRPGFFGGIPLLLALLDFLGLGATIAVPFLVFLATLALLFSGLLALLGFFRL